MTEQEIINYLGLGWRLVKTVDPSSTYTEIYTDEGVFRKFRVTQELLKSMIDKNLLKGELVFSSPKYEVTEYFLK